MEAECVKVIVRCRPMNTREKDMSCKCVVAMDSDRGGCTITNPGEAKASPKPFTFDGAYHIDSTTEAIYNEIAYPLVEGVTEGYNGTIFAYGQTGCGKSFTMQGISDPPSQRGIIPRAFDHIFETVGVAEETKFLIHASYCEIYNEEIRDLLGKDIRAKMELHEHPEKGVYVNGLSSHPVHNVVECNKIMEKGWKNRSTGATLMNADSSRSHSIFTIHLEILQEDEAGEEHIRAGKLNLVDLAGSERQSKTGATGARLKEATKINLSLSALGNVISALVDGKSKHIPYRDSKLTRLLQDSLGGNTKTLMVACLSPADNNYDETLSTLRYANRAKNIKNKPKINEDPKDALLRQYQEEIEKLKAMLMGKIPIEGGFTGVMSESSSRTTVKSESPDDEVRVQLEQEKEKIKEEYDERLREIEEQFHEEKVSKLKLEEDMNKLRAYYDTKIESLDGQIGQLPSTQEAKGPDNNDMRFKALQSFMESLKMSSELGKTGVSKKAGQAGSQQQVQGDSEQGTVTQDGESKKKALAPAVAGAAIVRNPDGTPARDAQGKQGTISGQSGGSGKQKIMTKPEYSDKAGADEGLERPGSVMGEALPGGPDLQEGEAMRISSVSDIGDELARSSGSDASSVTVPQAQVPDRAPNQTAIAHPDQDKKVTIVNGQMVIRQTQASGDESIVIRPTTSGVPQSGPLPGPGEEGYGPGSQAPRSSPTQMATQDQIRLAQNEALKRLEVLKQQFVGGENKENRDVKEKRAKRKKYAEERKRKLADTLREQKSQSLKENRASRQKHAKERKWKLAAANSKLEDDGIMLQIYDSIGDELKAKNKILEKEKEKNEALNTEIMDIQAEFEFQRIDYLDTIRTQEKQLQYLQGIIDRIHPCLRRDCNYSNLDKIKMMSKWDDDEQKWILPQMKIEKTSLPMGMTLPQGLGGNRSPRMSNGDYDEFDDRYRDRSVSPRLGPKIMKTQDTTGKFFQTRRQSQLVSEPLNKVDIKEVKKSYNIQPQTTLPATNGFSNGRLISDAPMSTGLKAAQVHGQLMNDEGLLRKPARLQALNPVGKKSKKKRNNYEDM